MSDIVAIFNPVTNTAQTFSAPQTAAQGSLVFWNESNNSLILTFQDGSRSYLPAWYHKHKCGPTGNVDIKWDIHAVLTSSNPPTSEIIVEAYGHGESFPADGPLVRQANGSTITSSMTTLTTLINDGAAPGSTIMESTPGTFPQSSVLLTNNGQLTLGDTTNQNGNVQVNGTETISGPLTAQNNVTVGGIFKISAGRIGKATDGDIIDANGTSTFLKGATSVIVQAPNGTTDVTVANTGVTINNGTLTLGGQRITQIKGFVGANTSTVTHGMGATPGFVVVTPNASSTCWVTNITSTTFTVNSSASAGWWAIAFIF